MNAEAPIAGADARRGSLPSGVALSPVPGLAETEVTRALSGWLGLLGWQGSADDLLAVLPHAEPRPDLTDLRNAMALLGHPTRGQRLRRAQVDVRLLPGLLVEPGRAMALLYRGEGGRLLRFDTASGETEAASAFGVSGTLYLAEPPAAAARGGWVAALVRRFRPEVPALLGISALITLVGLGVPVFTMAVVDTVVAGRAPDALAMLAAGALLALALEMGLRGLRRRALARIGERLDLLIPAAVFSQLMALPAALVERAGTAAQVSRLRDFAAIRDFLTGAAAVAVLDLPFSLLVLGLLLWLGGWIALVPLLAGLGFAALYVATRGAVQRAIVAASQRAQLREAMAVEALDAQRSIKLAGAEARFVARYHAAAADAALASARAAALSGHVMTAAQALVTLSGLAALVIGVVAVLAGAMSAGALIAGMMLIWRVLAPLQSGFVMLSRWEQTRASIRQVDGLLGLESERPAPGRARLLPPTRGDVQFHRVSLRYTQGSEPVLAGASFSVRHGEVVAVTGANGSGKSTLMKLAAGLYRPQGGVVRIDGQDLRAFDPAVLRRAMAFVPQSPDLLYGTIAQNLRLAKPSATDAELRAAAEAAHALDAIEALPEGWGTRVGDNATARLPRSLLVRITLARALLRDAPVLLLDEPVAGLDDVAADAIAEVIGRRRGGATILLATHRPSHIRLADRVLRLSEGLVEEAPTRPVNRLSLFQPAGAAP